MDIMARLEDDLKTAIKTRDAMHTSVLRMVKSALQNQQIAVGHELSNAEIITVLQKEAKKRQDSVEAYQRAGRDELAAQEQTEASAIAQYLPAQMDDAELDAIITEVIQATGATTKADMGRVMGQVIAKVAGRADSRHISELVATRLA